MPSCRHQFIKITECTKPIPNVHSVHRGIAGVIVGCAICGEVREIYEDGKLKVKE
jgi:hypothetical protein